MKKIILIFSLIGFFGCSQSYKQKQSSHFPVGSQWTFIKNDTAFKIDYAEIKFEDNGFLRIHSETEGENGPFKYEINDSLLVFNNFKFVITPHENGSLMLRNDMREFILYRIPFDMENVYSSQIDPFYLRRCYFLVHLNFISFDEAIKYLSNTTAIPEDSMPEEEIIFSNKK